MNVYSSIEFRLINPDKNSFIYNNKISISSNSKFDFENSKNRTKYQNLLNNKSTILRIQDYFYTSEKDFETINYKVITQIKTINLNTDNELFKKGKDIEAENYSTGLELIENNSIPSLGFWNQRYYYFSRYDEGISLDYESKIFNNFRLVFCDTRRNLTIYCKNL